MATAAETVIIPRSVASSVWIRAGGRRTQGWDQGIEQKQIEAGGQKQQQCYADDHSARLSHSVIMPRTPSSRQEPFTKPMQQCDIASWDDKGVTPVLFTWLRERELSRSESPET